ncbi:hypothetical protein Dsin_000310 [Dipteronia sinensis]|uniref:DEAD/DEAH-box helicase domain-containing protein n=1 Tax=Dipteronia sinensis TaxID=43782 RepID=A0AAE0EHM7_9ROSI|nr:hypothetical protein Dsin_000310 [Dipteronia sinensis]
MAKGEDAIRRRQNKTKRKKLQKKESSSNVTARVAAIIAAKQRRKAGKRRQCLGMCFSLPTPDDPFNDRHGKKEFQIKETKKPMSLKDKKAFVKGKSADLKKGTENEREKSHTFMYLKERRNSLNLEGTELPVNGKPAVNGHQEQACEYFDRPSKFLILCLNAIENALCHNGTYNVEEKKPLFVNHWGIEFWKCYSSGRDIIETSGSSSSVEHTAWMVSTAADSIARNEKEGLSFTSPFLLFLVPSQEKAAKVRSVCKSLKTLGIHTVSLHPGAPIDHQINGLKSCEPEFLVSTPERLLELVSLKAVDISGVSLLVVDELEALCKGGYLANVNSIRQSISGRPRTMVFNDSINYASVPAMQNLLIGSICRLSLNDSVASQSACILQSVNVCASEEEKLLKGIQVLDNAYGNSHCSQPVNVLYVVGKDGKFQKLVSALSLKGYSISTGSKCILSEVKNSLDTDRIKRPAVSMVDKDHIDTTELGEYEVVIIPDFVLSIENYVHILTKMARHTVKGVLHSFFTKEGDAPHAGKLIEILEQCGQAVPEALRDLSLTSTMLES